MRLWFPAVLISLVSLIGGPMSASVLASAPLPEVATDPFFVNAQNGWLPPSIDLGEAQEFDDPAKLGLDAEGQTVMWANLARLARKRPDADAVYVLAGNQWHRASDKLRKNWWLRLNKALPMTCQSVKEVQRAYLWPSTSSWCGLKPLMTYLCSVPSIASNFLYDASQGCGLCNRRPTLENSGRDWVDPELTEEEHQAAIEKTKERQTFTPKDGTAIAWTTMTAVEHESCSVETEETEEHGCCPLVSTTAANSYRTYYPNNHRGTGCLACYRTFWGLIAGCGSCVSDCLLLGVKAGNNLERCCYGQNDEQRTPLLGPPPQSMTTDYPKAPPPSPVSTTSQTSTTAPLTKEEIAANASAPLPESHSDTVA